MGLESPGAFWGCFCDVPNNSCISWGLTNFNKKTQLINRIIVIPTCRLGEFENIWVDLGGFEYIGMDFNRCMRTCVDLRGFA